MATPGERSIVEILAEWHPPFDQKWKRWIREAYVQYTSENAEDRVTGARSFTVILGDSYAPELCVLVALYGLKLANTEKACRGFESAITIVACDLGIVRPKKDVAPGAGIPAVDFGNREKWLINQPAWELWRDHMLEDFGGDRQLASDFSVRLACARAGILVGEEPTFGALCNPAVWRLTEAV
jgi:hypothetical protein